MYNHSGVTYPELEGIVLECLFHGNGLIQIITKHTYSEVESRDLIIGWSGINIPIGGYITVTMEQVEGVKKPEVLKTLTKKITQVLNNIPPDINKQKYI